MPRPADLARPSRWLPAVVLLVIVLATWQLTALNDHSLQLPTLGQVGGQLTQHSGYLFSNGLDTLAEALPGVAISAVVALALAVAMSQWGLVRRAVFPFAIVLNVTPLIALAPALGVIFGFSWVPRVVIVAVITFFPSLMNSIAGLRSYDPEAMEVLQSLHASRWEVLWRLQLPSSLPFLFAAARIVVPLAVIGAVISEMVSDGADNGLGYVVATVFDGNSASYPLAWAAIVTLALFGLALTAAVVAAESSVLRWRGFR